MNRGRSWGDAKAAWIHTQGERLFARAPLGAVPALRLVCDIVRRGPERRAGCRAQQVRELFEMWEAREVAQVTLPFETD